MLKPRLGAETSQRSWLRFPPLRKDCGSLRSILLVHFPHEVWVPAGAKAIIILEAGWKVNWVDGPPTANDIGKAAPPKSFEQPLP